MHLKRSELLYDIVQQFTSLIIILHLYFHIPRFPSITLQNTTAIHALALAVTIAGLTTTDVGRLPPSRKLPKKESVTQTKNA